MIKKSLKFLLGCTLLTTTVNLKVRANVVPNSLFTNNMVIQQGVKVPIWGKASEGEKITVSFAGQTVSTVAKQGKWQVNLQPIKANSIPQKMSIQGDNLVEISNVLVGEVWICSGQSNMEMALGKSWPLPVTNAQEEIAKANYPSIRQYSIQRRASDTLVWDANASWMICDTANAKNFTAVGYFFGRDLYNHFHVPIGLIFSAWGGTPAERWTPRDVLAADTGLKKIVDAYNQAAKEYPIERAKYKEEEKAKLVQWVADTLAASLAHKTIPKKPTPPANPLGGAGGIYNSMIHPLIPYAIKGVIWYQGEADRDKSNQYKRLFPAMINAWRTNFGQGQFPFLFAMIAPWMNQSPLIREAQLFTLSKVPNTAMASTIDCGDSANIHPPHKQPVGERLAIAARALAYNEKIEYAGPMYSSDKIVGNKIEITYTHVGKGLESKSGDLIGFAIAGEDKKFVPATAVIKGNKVEVSNPNISNPKYVRFGWANFPKINLYNKDGLPAVPFRTDID